MSWIKVIDYQHADTKLKGIYDRVKGPNAQIDNVLKVHSLRPHTLMGHLTLYKNVLHHSGNHLPKWYLELLGVYVSCLNNCDYCVEHHFAGLRTLLKDDILADRLLVAVKSGGFEHVLEPKLVAGTGYARLLTLSPSEVSKENIKNLTSHGFDDGEILEVNQVVSYFNYVNRTVQGLGVKTEGETLGLAPKKSEDPDNWSHY